MTYNSRGATFLCMYTTYLFDFDGTIADSSRCAIDSTIETFRNFDIPEPSEAAVVDLMGVPIERSFEILGGEIFLSRKATEVYTFFRKVYAAKSETSISVFAGIPDLIMALLQTGCNIAIVSSKKSDVVRNNLKTLYLSEYVKMIVGSDNVDHYKPHPEPIQKALNILGSADLSEVLMIGDATVDIEMAHRAGVDSCGVTWGAHSEEQLITACPNYLARNPSEILGLRPRLKSG